MITRLCALALAAAQIAPAQAEGFRPAEDLVGLNGTYRSTAPEPWYGGYGVREFVMEDGHWSLIFTHAMDPAMVHRTFQYRAGGPYEILGASADVAGAFQGHFTYEWKHVTLLTDDPQLQEAYGLAACDLQMNLEADITETGCGHWQPVAKCDADYDLLALDDEGLHWGVRAADNNQCTPDKTPTALLPAVAPFGGGA
ncbi:MAG: hypothetical protein AAFY59_02585 [Pseudomonadota bacterium]